MARKSQTATDLVPMRAATQGSWTTETKLRLVKGVEDYKLPSKPEWSGLDELSSRTEFEGLQVFAEDAIFDGKEFLAPATVYVKLNYDSSSDEPVAFSESFPASVVFQVNAAGEVLVKKVNVDTTSFFDGDDHTSSEG